MKRSKIFLGITTGVLAVVAFTAAKSAKFSTQVRGYITSSNSKCTLAAVGGIKYYTNGFNIARTNSSGGRTIYEFQAAPCNVPLFTVQGSND